MRHRRLTEAEVAFVKRMLAIANLSRSPFAKQLPSLRVVRKCECGCPTVDFVILPLGKPLVDAYAQTREGKVVGAILWQRDDGLSGLELYSMVADPKELPDPGTLSFDPTSDAG